MGSDFLLTSSDFNPGHIHIISTTYMELFQNKTCAGLMEATEESKYFSLLHKISFFIQVIIHVCHYLDFQM